MIFLIGPQKRLLTLHLSLITEKKKKEGRIKKKKQAF
jgi:hypothetical protein